MSQPSQTSTPKLGVLTDCPPEIPLPTSRPPDLMLVGEQQAWYWAAEKNQLEPYPLPTPDGGQWRKIKISADGRFVAYQIPAAEPPPADRPRLGYSETPQRDQELWLLDRLSGQSRKISGPPPAATTQRYPNEPEFDYETRWVNDSHLLGFASQSRYNGMRTYEDFFLWDADSGRAWQLFAGGEVGAMIFRPDLRQAAALAVSKDWKDAQGELRLIELASGKMEQRIPLELKYGGIWQQLSYAPDNRHVAVMISDGIAVIEVDSGDVQTVPLEFDCQGPGSGFCSLPEPIWAEDGQSFTVWVEYAPPAGSPTPIQATQYLVSWSADGKLRIYTGLTINTGWWGPRSLSPDGQFLLFASPEEQLQPGGKPDTIITFIQPIQGGEPVRYLEGKNVYPGQWSPDSRRFLITETGHTYESAITLSLAVGHICQRPTALPLPETGWLAGAIWLDTNSFLALFAEGTEEPTQWRYTLYRYDLSVQDSRKLQSFAASTNSLSIFPVNEE